MGTTSNAHVARCLSSVQQIVDQAVCDIEVLMLLLSVSLVL